MFLSFSGTILTSHAGFINLNGYAYNMEPGVKHVRTQDMPLQHVGNRMYNVSELFINSIDYGTPYGNAKDDWLFNDKETIKDFVQLDEQQKARLDEHGKKVSSVATLGGIGESVRTGLLHTANMMASIITQLVNSLFRDDFICKEDSKNMCIDLLGVMTGEKGMLKSLSNGLFLPLSVLAFVFVGVWVLWKGVIKKEFRASIGGILWALFSFVLGILVMVKPDFVAKFPQSINSVTANCIVSAINGGNCLTNTNGSDINNLMDICQSNSTATTEQSEKLELQLNSVTCNIVKGFTLDYWSKEMFGYYFDELWTVSPDSSSKYTLYTNIQGPATNYCVNMYSTTSPSGFSGPIIHDPTQTSNHLTTKLVFTDKPKCNIALAYLAKRTKGDFGVKASMYDFIATAAKDDKMMSALGGGQRDWPILSWVMIGFAVITFVPATIFAHIYSLTGTVLMFFAPVFLLIGIHPGRGRKIMLGWTESAISSLLKFFASALLVLIMVIVYSSVMLTMKGLSLFIATIVLGGVFWMYRKELVNIIGEVNMGGQRLTNHVEKRAEKLATSTKNVVGAVAGGALGGFMGAEEGKRLDGIKQGAAEGLKIEAKRGRGFIASATRESDSIKEKHKREEQINKLKSQEENKDKPTKDVPLNNGNDIDLDKINNQEEKEKKALDLDNDSASSEKIIDNKSILAEKTPYELKKERNKKKNKNNSFNKNSNKKIRGKKRKSIKEIKD